MWKAIGPPLLPSTGRDSLDIPIGPLNDTGLSRDNTASKKEGVYKEIKVLVMRKISHHKQAQYSGTLTTKKKSPASSTNPPFADSEHPIQKCFIDKVPIQHQSSIDMADTTAPLEKINEDDMEEAASQWEIAKILGVHSESDHAEIINKITERESRDKKVAAEKGKNHRPL